MKTAILLCCSAVIGFGSIGCSNAQYGSGSTTNDGSYGTPSTAGSTIPGSENTNSNASAATPRDPNQAGAPQGINPSAGTSNGPTGYTGQSTNNNQNNAISPTK